MYLRTELYKKKKSLKNKSYTKKRTYYRKKKGEWVTKYYKYNYDESKGYGTQVGKLMFKSGKTTKLYDKLKIEIKKKYKDWQADKIIDNLDARIREARRKGRIYELNTFISHLKGVEFDEEMHQLVESKRNIERYIYNMGGDPDELANQIGVKLNTLLDNDNWSEDTFINPTSLASYSLNVRYEDGVVTWGIA